MKKMLFIFNPHTGGGQLKNKLLPVLTTFSDAGYEVWAHPTSSRGDAQKIAAEKGAEHDIVVCCGGDGTLNEVVNGLLTLNPVPLLGYIPGGTTNDFAASLNLPKSDMLAAANRIINPRKVFHCDIGCFGGHHFNYVAAFGAFTEVSYKTPQKFKNLLGYMAYVVEGALQLGHLPTCHARFDCCDKTYEGDYLFGMVANSSSVGGFSFASNKKVKLDDGLFELLLIQRPQNLGELSELSRALLTKNIQSPLVTAARISRGNFCFDEETAWTLDGEFGGNHTALEITVQNKVLPMCV